MKKKESIDINQFVIKWIMTLFTIQFPFHIVKN